MGRSVPDAWKDLVRGQDRAGQEGVTDRQAPTDSQALRRRILQGRVIRQSRHGATRGATGCEGGLCPRGSIRLGARSSHHAILVCLTRIRISLGMRSSHHAICIHCSWFLLLERWHRLPNNRNQLHLGQGGRCGGSRRYIYPLSRSEPLSPLTSTRICVLTRACASGLPPPPPPEE